MMYIKALKGALFAGVIATSGMVGAQPADTANTAISRARVMSPQLVEALNKQLKSELTSAYLYFSMASYFEGENLQGFAKWFRVQASEEMDHANRVMKFMNDRGADIKLPALDAPEMNFSSPIQVFQMGLENEQKLSLQIMDLYALSQELKEYDANAFLQWFLSEQVEEEDLFYSIMTRLLMIGEDSPASILIMDQHLGSRVGA